MARRSRAGGFGIRTAAAACLLPLMLAGCGAAAAKHHASSSAPPSAGHSGVPVGSHSTTAAKPPVMKEFAPYNEAGAATVAISRAGTGSCFATSITVPVSGVYRCLVGNTILDPCFASVTETTPPSVACFADPWSTGQLITVTGALPTYNPDLRQGDPWGLELANGARCVSVTGAVPVLGDVNLTYRCGGSDVAGITDNTDGSVTAHYGPSDGPLVDTPVVVEWRGRSYRLAGTP